MKAISTKYLPATNTRGARIKAYCDDLSAVVSYPYELSDQHAHFKAVKELVRKHGLNWDLEEMRFGATEKGYVFCFADAIVLMEDKTRKNESLETWEKSFWSEMQNAQY